MLYVMPLVALLLNTALAQEGEPWLVQSVAPQLHPVGPAFLRDWQLNTRDLMAGQRASPLFRSTAAGMDVHWRLAAYDTEMPWLFEEQQEQARQLAWLGTSLGFQQTVQAIVSQSPEISALYMGIRTVTAPSIEIRGTPNRSGGGPRVKLNQGSRNRAAAMASLSEAPLSARSRQTRVRIGSGVNVVQLQPPGAAEDQQVYTLGLVSSVEADRIGPLSFRAAAAVVQPGPDATHVNWNGNARVPLRYGVSILNNINGTAEAVTRISSGVEYRPGASPYNVRLTASQRLDLGEERVMLSVTRQLRWTLPVDIERWPLGAEPGTRGPYLPQLPDRSPHQLTGTLTIGSFAGRAQAAEGLAGVPGDVRVTTLP